MPDQMWGEGSQREEGHMDGDQTWGSRLWGKTLSERTPISGKQERGPQKKILYSRCSKLPLWLHLRKSDKYAKPEDRSHCGHLRSDLRSDREDLKPCSGLSGQQGEEILADATVLVPRFLCFILSRSSACFSHNLDYESTPSPLEDLNTAGLEMNTEG